jgi:LacI family transcriptional regulator
MPEADGEVRPRPTIYDVAREAGVAASTVSRAFARPGRVNAATAERVKAAASRLGYRVNPLARALPTGRTSILALSVSDVTNPFYAEIIRGAQAAATEAKFTMILADGQESDVLERESLERAMATVEGIVLATSRMSDAAIRSTARQKPMVVLNRHVTDVPSLITDNAAGVRRAVEHLAARGHRGITYVAGPEASWADGARWRALRAATSDLGLSARRVGPFRPTVEGGAVAADELRRHPPTAILAYNDQVAIGIIRHFVGTGIAVPGEVSIIGFDDIFAARLITPALTTITAALQQMGAIAVRNLIAMIRGANATAKDPLVVPTRLIERESTGPVRAGVIPRL